jgi:hypothetical protein
LRTWLLGKSVFRVNLGVNWNKLKFRDLIGFLGGLIGWIKGLIVRILKFGMQLGTWLKNSKTKNKTEKKTHEVVSESIILLLLTKRKP